MSKLIHPEFTTVDGLSIRFAEGGNAGQDAISLSPWPESVYAFEQVWTRLAVRRDPGGLHVVLRGRSFRRHDPLRPGLPRAAADAARSVARHQTPVRIVQESDDQVVPPVNAEYLGDHLPRSRVDFIAGAGHFCWEEQPDEYASLVTQWWAENAG